VIGSDDALIVEAQAAGQIETAGQRAEVANGFGGRMGEALVVVGTKQSEHGIGLQQSGGASQTEFTDQTVLESTPGTLDATLGLG
jgi:hypothetical protein